MPRPTACFVSQGKGDVRHGSARWLTGSTLRSGGHFLHFTIGVALAHCVHMPCGLKSSRGLEHVPVLFACPLTSHMPVRIIRMSYRCAVEITRRDRSWHNHSMQ
jgi:hypothetical protein